MQSLRELEKLIYMEANNIPRTKKETSKDFFKKHKNRYLVNIIYSFLTFEDRVKLRFLNKLFYSQADLSSTLTNLDKLKEDFIIYVNNKHTFETCLYYFDELKIKKKQEIYTDLLISEFYSAWAYSNYFKKITSDTVRIDLHHNRYSSRSKQLLLHTLKHIKQPMDILFYDIALDEREMELLFKFIKNKNVCTLSIGKNITISEELADTIYESLVTLKNLKSINLDESITTEYVLNKVTSSFKSLFELERIELNHNQFTIDGLDCFLNNLSKLPKLKHLYLIDNNIDYKGANLLGLYLGSWFSTSLTNISLDENPFGVQGVIQIMEGVKKNKNLVYLSLSKIKANLLAFENFVDALEDNKSLRKIRYSYNEVNHKLIHRLNDEILPTTKIETVELFNNILSVGSIKLHIHKGHKILM
jgi:hypothetical protein